MIALKIVSTYMYFKKAQRKNFENLYFYFPSRTMRRCISKSWLSRFKRSGRQILFLIYFLLLVFAFFNYRSHCVETMPNLLLKMAIVDNTAQGRCNLHFEKLGMCTVSYFIPFNIKPSGFLLLLFYVQLQLKSRL